MPEVGDTRVVWLDDQHEVGMRFCWIPPGKFRMGSRNGDLDEQPVHCVIFDEGFWLGQTPVTQRQYAVRFPEHKNGFPDRDDHPAEEMTWQDARRYCEWLKQHWLDHPEWLADLPTETQWEYACRAGTETEYHTGDGDPALARAGWYEDNSDGSTHQVGGKAANAFGLYDMHGNVWEWCRDIWSEGLFRYRCLVPAISLCADDMVTGTAGSARALRGGSWYNHAASCRSAFRNSSPRRVGFDGRGFRVGLFPDPSYKSVHDVWIQAEIASENGRDQTAPDRVAPTDA